MSHTFRKRALLPIFGAVLAVGLVVAQTASANIIRPKSATPFQASMVIAYNNCAAATPPTETHNPLNLPGAACTPPVKSTTRLTAGDPALNGAVANFQGVVKLVVPASGGNVLFPAGTGSHAGGCTTSPTCGNYFQDVRCEPTYASTALGSVPCGQPGGANGAAPPDYAGGSGGPPATPGSLNVISNIRITDQANSGPSATCPPTCPDDATVANLNFAVPADCDVTAATTIGAFCTPRFASAQAECGCVATNHRSNIELGQIFAMDGGDDGIVQALAPDTDTPMVYSRMGVFIP